MADQSRQIKQGTASVTNASKTATVIAAQGAGKKLRILTVQICVTDAATGGTGTWRLNDGVGGTAILTGDGDLAGTFSLTIGPSDGIGYDLGANNALQLQVAGAGTTEASVNCLAMAVVLI